MNIKYNIKNIMKESKLKVPVTPNNMNHNNQETSKPKLTTPTTKNEFKKQQQQKKTPKSKQEKTYKSKTTKKQNNVPQTNNIRRYFSTTTKENKQHEETVQNVTQTQVPNREKEGMGSTAAVTRLTGDDVKSNFQVLIQETKETTFTSKQQLDSDYCGPNDLEI